MGSPTIFSGRYTKLLTQKGLLQQGGAVNQYDGLRNYIKNSSFESNTDEGWNRVKTTITGNLPTGTPTIGKAIAVAPSISSFGPFSGSAPFDRFALRFGNIISTVVAGEGVISDAFTVDPGDRGKVLTFKLYYQSDAGASTDNWSGVLGSQTWAVYIYDQTAGAWLQPTGFLGMNQNSGVGVVSGTFQSSVVAGQQYRIALIALRNTTATSALQIDDVYVGPQTAPIGPVVTDFQAYIPATTGFNPGTTPSIFVRWRRVGDSIHVIGNYVAGGAGIGASGDFEIFLPSGLSFDTTKVSGGGAIGAAEVHNSGLYRYGASSILYSPTSFKMTARANAATGGNNVSNAIPEAGWWNAAGDQFSFEIMAPIQGWSSSVQMSNDTDTRVVAFAATKSAIQSIPNNVYTFVDFNAVEINTHGSTYAAGAYTIPVSGFYRVAVNFNFQSGSGGTIFTVLYKNGVQAYRIGTQPFATTQSGGSCSTTAYFNAGETVSIGIIQLTGSAQTLEPAGRFTVDRLSGPSVVAASETVAAVYQTGAGQSIPNNTATPIVYGTKVFDTHSAMNSSTGVYTVPVSGTFEVKASHYFGNAITATATDVQTIVQLDGVSMFGSNLTKSGTVAAPLTTLGSFLVKANAGQTIRMALLQSNSTASAQALLANVTFNWISINRVGN
jgi:hypothetical protein